MARVVDKPIIRVGDWIEKDGRRLEFSRPLVERLLQSFAAMRSRGVRVPVFWGHNEDARNEAGEVVGLWVSDGWLTARLNLSDPEAIRKVGTVVKTVSPRVMIDTPEEPVIDGKGNRYPAAVIHLALVSRPVIPGQKNFEAAYDSGGRGLSFSLSLGVDPMNDQTDKYAAMTAAMDDEQRKTFDTMSEQHKELVLSMFSKNTTDMSVGPDQAAMIAQKRDEVGGSRPKNKKKIYNRREMKGNWPRNASLSEEEVDGESAADELSELVSRHGKDKIDAALKDMGYKLSDDDELQREKRDVMMSLDDMAPRDRRMVAMGRDALIAKINSAADEGRINARTANRLLSQVRKPDFLLSLANADEGATDVERALAAFCDVPAGTFPTAKHRTAGYHDLSLGRERHPDVDGQEAARREYETLQRFGDGYGRKTR